MRLCVDRASMQPDKKRYEYLQPKASFTPFAACPRYRQRKKQRGSGNLIWHELKNRLYLVFSVELDTFGLLLEGVSWTIRLKRKPKMPDKSKKGGEERNKEQAKNLSGRLFEHATHHAAALRLHPSPAPPPHTSAHR